MESGFPPAQYSSEETERGLRFGIADGICSNAMMTLSSGAILSALAIFAQMSDLEFGVLASLPFLAQLLQLPGGLLLRRFQNRKAIVIGFATAGRLALFGVAAAALTLTGPELRAGLFAGFLLWSAFGAISAGAWLWWMRDLVPADRLGRYFGKRGAFYLGASVPVLLLAGYFIDRQSSVPGVPGSPAAFFAVYVVAALFGIGSSLFLMFIPHRPPRDDPTSVPFADAIREPFKEPNFRRFLSWQLLYGLGTTVAAPFFPLYLLLDHRLPLTAVTAVLVVGTATTVVFFWLWGRLSDRFGNKPVLSLSAPVFAAGLTLTLAVPPGGGPLTYLVVLVVQLLLSVATASADLTAWNLAFKLARGPSTPSYLTGMLLVRSLSTGIGPIAGGILAAQFAAMSLSSGVAGSAFDVSHYEFVFVLGAVLAMASATPLRALKETGEAPRGELIRALRAEVAGGARPRKGRGAR